LSPTPEPTDEPTFTPTPTATRASPKGLAWQFLAAPGTAGRALGAAS
jgi:hypothetical protein